MNFGHEFICNICKKNIDGNYHRFNCDIPGIDMEFYTCQGACYEEFCDEHVEPYKEIENRFEILDL